MKIAVLGYSGSGKSTLARLLAEKYQIDVLHFDTVQFLPGWVIRGQDEKARMTKEFLDTHDAWIIDGNYSRLSFDRRMAEADEIVFLLFNRFSSLYRAYSRYRKFAGLCRPDMAEGCPEKFDWEFATWILWKGRGKKTKDLFRGAMTQYPDKVVIIKNQKQLDAYMASKGVTYGI
ncbi:MAG: DNA topology modulation protein FlaR [Oscillospiraceae bacterium]|nr:DNA topology modulation protein FlaR [Oscillospiraceae bacterium]